MARVKLGAYIKPATKEEEFVLQQNMIEANPGYIKYEFEEAGTSDDDVIKFFIKNEDKEALDNYRHNTKEFLQKGQIMWLVGHKADENVESGFVRSFKKPPLDLSTGQLINVGGIDATDTTEN
jgi:hypothetical protein